MSKATEIYTIVSALEKAEETMSLKKDWKPKNEIQKKFLKNFYLCRDDKIEEIDVEVSDNAEKINRFLKKKGFSIVLQPFPPNTLGFASILDLIVEWLYPGEKVKIDDNEGKIYEGVRIKKESVYFFESKVDGYNHIIACIRTRTGDSVFITVPRKLEEGFDLLEKADALSKNINILHNKYDGLRFPMVDLDITNEIDWLRGISTKSVNGDIPIKITQAVQQIKIKMNDKGARFQSATAVAATLMCVAVPKDLIIREPFLVWVNRNGIKKPIVAAFVTKENWRNPGNLK